MSNVQCCYRLLTVLPKKTLLDAWLAPECPSADGNNTVLKIQTEISPGQQVKME